jgi:hypothetical protein
MVKSGLAVGGLARTCEDVPLDAPLGASERVWCRSEHVEERAEESLLA